MYGIYAKISKITSKEDGKFENIIASKVIYYTNNEKWLLRKNDLIKLIKYASPWLDYYVKIVKRKKLYNLWFGLSHQSP